MPFGPPDVHSTVRFLSRLIQFGQILCFDDDTVILIIVNNLHGSAGFRTDTQIVTKKAMRSIIAQTKAVDKSDDGDDE